MEKKAKRQGDFVAMDRTLVGGIPRKPPKGFNVDVVTIMLGGRGMNT
jgi:hypothetical protein